MSRSASAAAPVTATPSTSTWPAVGVTSPLRQRSSVDFPAPLGADQGHELAPGHVEVDAIQSP